MSKTDAEWKAETTLSLSESKRTLHKAIGQLCSLLSETLILASDHIPGTPVELVWLIRCLYPALLSPCGFYQVARVWVVSFGNTAWQLWVIWFICKWPIKVTVRHFQLQKLEQSLVHKCSKAFDKTDLKETNRYRNIDWRIPFHIFKDSKEGDLQIST